MFSNKVRSYYNFAYQPVRQHDIGNTPFHWNDNNSGNLGQGGCWSIYGALKLWQKVACVVILLLVAVLSYLAVSWALQGTVSRTVKTRRGAEFERFVQGEYNGRVFNGTWISGTEFFYLDHVGNLFIHNCENHSDELIIDRTALTILPDSFDFTFSADRQYLLFVSGYQSIFRHSFLGQYFLLHLESKTVKPLAHDMLSFVQWAPVGHGIAYVTKNFNIWYKQDPMSDDDIQETYNGVVESIYNGVADWVYEEEVLESSGALWFSTDGKKLAFITFNDTMVPIYTIPIYGKPGAISFQYPIQYPIHYPKAGKSNPTVQIKVADLTQNMSSLTFHYYPPESVKPEPLIASITWATNTSFLLIWTNRYQNVTSYCMCSTITEHCEEKFVYKQHDGWIIPHFHPIFDPEGERMVSILKMDEGGNDRYPHVVLFDFREQNITPVDLTRGKITVSQITKWDTDNEIVYFISTVEGKSEQLQTHFTSSNINNETGKYTCLSCDNYKTVEGKPCLYAGSMFSTDASHYVVTCNGPDVPEVTIYNKTHHPIMLWERNEELRELVKKTDFLTHTIFEVPLEDNFTAKVHLSHPEIDLSQDKKYPLLIKVYGGPESSLVTEQYAMNFEKYYASNRSVYVALIDGRGSGLRGSRNMFAINRKLGTYEVQDQLTVVKYLLKKFKTIDPTRIGVWGWSYGGYVTGMMLATDTENIMKCGVSVSPVTDWLLYDTVYTERYMGAPTQSDNYVGYFNSSLNRKVLGLRDKMFFLIHGTRDDNVHYQNSMFLAKVLEQNDIYFRQMTYTDEDHSMRTVYRHFFHSIQHFLDECFNINQTLTKTV